MRRWSWWYNYLKIDQVSQSSRPIGGLALVADRVYLRLEPADCSGFASPWPSRRCSLASRSISPPVLLTGLETILSRSVARIILSTAWTLLREAVKDHPVAVYYSRHRVFTWLGDRRWYHNSSSYRRAVRAANLTRDATALPPHGSDSNSDIDRPTKLNRLGRTWLSFPPTNFMNLDEYKIPRFAPPRPSFFPSIHALSTLLRIARTLHLAFFIFRVRKRHSTRKW